MIGRVHSVESFGTVDGPGIRMVIFLSGCPMRCIYCHNPDTWDPKGGKPMTVEEILAQFEQARPFYKKGGITVSGGEPLMQIPFVTELFEAARARKIHTCLDTSGITFNPSSEGVMAMFDRLMAVTDLVMLDIKHIDPEEHIKPVSYTHLDVYKRQEDNQNPLLSQLASEFLEGAENPLNYLEPDTVEEAQNNTDSAVQGPDVYKRQIHRSRS